MPQAYPGWGTFCGYRRPASLRITAQDTAKPQCRPNCRQASPMVGSYTIGRKRAGSDIMRMGHLGWIDDAIELLFRHQRELQRGLP